MECPECYRSISTVQCCSCWCDLQLEFQTVYLGGIKSYTIGANTNREKEVEKQRTVAEAAEERLSFLKLQVPVKSSKDSDLLSGKVTILVQGSNEIPAHRFILADKSPVFRRMFDSEMKESKTGVISIDDASYAGMQSVVKFCYTAEIDFTEDVRPEEVLKIAHKYQILHLRDRCAEELCGRIAKENFIDMMRLSRDYEAQQLQKELAKYLRKQFKDVFEIVLEAV